MVTAVRPVLRPLLALAAVERPAAFETWLAEKLEKAAPSAHEAARVQEAEEQSEIEGASFKALNKVGFTDKIGELLMRVKTKQQVKLTAEDLEAIAAWLDEDSSQIDDWIVDPNGKKYTPLRLAASLGESLIRLLLRRFCV